MRIGSNTPAGALQRRDAQTKARDGASNLSSSQTGRTADSATIMGVPEAELTPNVQRALLSLMGEVDQMRKETEMLRQKVRELEMLADRDVFLPVLNRRAFLREVSKALALAERHDAPSTLLYFDLNGFKQINDTHGHAAGDQALKMVAELIAAHIRETDSVGRLGGDEFGIVLSLTPLEAAETKAKTLVEALEQTPIMYEGHEMRLSAAWGSRLLERGTDVETAMADADAAMYARKTRAA